MECVYRRISQYRERVHRNAKFHHSESEHDSGINIPLIPRWEDPSATAGSLNGMQGVAGMAGAALAMPNLATGATAQPQSGQILQLPQAAKPQLAQMQPGTISKTVAQNQTTDKSLKIYGGITINANDPHQFEQYLRDKQQLAAG